jgi:hypothetical protein
VDPGWIVAAISLVTFSFGLLTFLARWAWKTSRRISQFLDDYFGKPAAPGHQAEPGVMERLGNLEVLGRDISHEVHLNSGRSIKDTVMRTEQAVTDLSQQVGSLSQQVARLDKQARP